MAIKIAYLSGEFSVCRLAPSEPQPDWIDRSRFWCMTGTPEELSVVCASEGVPASVRAEHGWAILKVQGPLDFSLTGILASIAAPLADAKISIFAVSTFDTDYVLVKTECLEAAREVLEKSGFEVPTRG